MIASLGHTCSVAIADGPRVAAMLARASAASVARAVACLVRGRGPCRRRRAWSTASACEEHDPRSRADRRAPGRQRARDRPAPRRIACRFPLKMFAGSRRSVFAPSERCERSRVRPRRPAGCACARCAFPRRRRRSGAAHAVHSARGPRGRGRARVRYRRDAGAHVRRQDAYRSALGSSSGRAVAAARVELELHLDAAMLRESAAHVAPLAADDSPRDEGRHERISHRARRARSTCAALGGERSPRCAPPENRAPRSRRTRARREAPARAV